MATLKTRLHNNYDNGGDGDDDRRRRIPIFKKCQGIAPFLKIITKAL